LVAASPALWNVLLPTSANNANLLALNTAGESRCFPRLTYNVQKGEQFGSRFDIGANPQPEKYFPSYPQEIKTPSGKQSEKYFMTVADFLTMDASVVNQLEVVPGKYRGENLMPLAKYLSADQSELIGATPFIWMLDEANVLQQAAIPLSLLNRCRERLDNWQFIQELGGLNSYHVNKAIERAKAEWEEEKENEIAQFRAEMESEVEIVRKEESGKAMDRLVNVLLDLDDIPVSTSAKAPKATVATPKVSETEAAEPEKSAPAKEEEEDMGSEVWVETFRCTSCNDCTDQLPAVFKYNGDKQAEVHNPKAGTYAKIVTVAEKCPAKCIHPGLPQDPNEKGSEDLIARAKAIH
jgi:ferredoxin